MPTADLDIALAQIPSVPGDVEANVAIACEHTRMGGAAGAALIVFPELSLVGYHLDLLDDGARWLTPGDARLDPLRAVAAQLAITVVVGSRGRRARGMGVCRY